MQLSLTRYELAQYLTSQLNNFFPDKIGFVNIDKVIDIAIDRLSYSFKHIKSKYYNDGSNVIFNHLNSDHYASFLYFLSNTAYKENNLLLAEKAFYLNKVMHGVDAFYSVNLPDIFLFVHPLGTVLGNATYEDYLVIYQNVTVGSKIDGVYPSFLGKNILYAKTSVIGSCAIGSNVIFGTNATLLDTNIENNKTVLGIYPNNKIINTNETLISHYFKIS